MTTEKRFPVTLPDTKNKKKTRTNAVPRSLQGLEDLLLQNNKDL